MDKSLVLLYDIQLRISMKRNLRNLLNKQLRLGAKIIKLSQQIEMQMTYEKTWYLSSNIEQIAYDLSRTIQELNEQLS